MEEGDCTWKFQEGLLGELAFFLLSVLFLFFETRFHPGCPVTHPVDENLKFRETDFLCLLSTGIKVMCYHCPAGEMTLDGYFSSQDIHEKRKNRSQDRFFSF